MSDNNKLKKRNTKNKHSLEDTICPIDLTHETENRDNSKTNNTRPIPQIDKFPQNNQDEDEKQFSDKLTKFIQPLRYFAMSLTRNENDAEDLVQEALFKALKHQRQFKKGTNLKAWLLTILRNSYINLYRKRKREHLDMDFMKIIKLVPDEKSAEQFSFPLENLLTFEDISEQLSDKVKNALQELSEDYRQIFLLSVVEKFSYREISHLLEIPIGTVMSRLFRARKQMQEKLKEYAFEQGFIAAI